MPPLGPKYFLPRYRVVDGVSAAEVTALSLVLLVPASAGGPRLLSAGALRSRRPVLVFPLKQTHPLTESLL